MACTGTALLYFAFIAVGLRLFAVARYLRQVSEESHSQKCRCPCLGSKRKHFEVFFKKECSAVSQFQKIGADVQYSQRPAQCSRRMACPPADTERSTACLSCKMKLNALPLVLYKRVRHMLVMQECGCPPVYRS
jgi:hypothetical protein